MYTSAGKPALWPSVLTFFQMRVAGRLHWSRGGTGQCFLQAILQHAFIGVDPQGLLSSVKPQVIRETIGPLQLESTNVSHKCSCERWVQPTVLDF
jgi:hypothetical protein